MNTRAFREQNDLSEAKVDVDGRMIHNVILIRAGLSKNKRRYSEAVLQAAAPVFENSPAYADHPQKPGQSRSFRDITGQYVNVHFEDGALRADRVFARTQAGNDALGVAQDVIEGRLSPMVAGLSINAVGSGKPVKESAGEVFEVESITHAVSIDDVASPAAGGSYREQAETSDLTGMLLESITFEEWFAARPEFTKRVQNEMKTARQDEALSAANAVADGLRRELQEAQEALRQAQAASEAAVSERDTARRELAIERTLASVDVPSAWVTDLRKRLMEAEQATWPTIIEAEKTKARSAGHRGVVVTGAGQQVQTTVVVESASRQPKPLDMSRFDTPEQFAAYMRGLSQ